MGLTSSRESRAEDIYNRLSRENFSVSNPFTHHTLRYQPLSVEALDTRTEDIYSGAIRDLRSLLQSRLMEDMRGTAQRLQTQGVAGGIRDALQRRLASQYAEQEQRGISQLLNQQAQQKYENVLRANQSAMGYENLLLDLLTKRAGVDLSNTQSRMQRYNMQSNLLQNFDDTTWLDDVLALAKTGANIYTGLKMGKIV